MDVRRTRFNLSAALVARRLRRARSTVQRSSPTRRVTVSWAGEPQQLASGSRLARAIVVLGVVAALTNVVAGGCALLTARINHDTAVLSQRAPKRVCAVTAKELFVRDFGGTLTQSPAPRAPSSRRVQAR
jgi:hypothetical protein